MTLSARIKGSSVIEHLAEYKDIAAYHTTAGTIPGAPRSPELRQAEKDQEAARCLYLGLL